MDALWWQPHGALHASLQNFGPSTHESVKKLLDSQFAWLQNVVLNFKQPSAANRKTINESPSISLRGKRFTVDVSLRAVTLQLSSVLDLDELQTHILLKRWKKDSGLEDRLQDSSKPAPFNHEDLLEAVCWAPHTGTAEQLFEDTTSKLLKGGLEDQLFAALRANVDTFQPPVQGSTPSPGSIAGRVNSAMKEFGNMGSSPWVLGVYSALRQHLLEERCELLSCLLILYEVAGAKCATLRQAQLVDLLAQARALDAAAGAGGGVGPTAGGAGAQPALDSSTVAEYLSGALVLSALGLPDYIAMVQAGPGSVARGPDSLPLGGKMKDVHASIRGWAGGQASVMLFLAWGSVVRLLEQLLDQQLELGDAQALEELQGKAAAAGSFAGAAAVIEGAEQVVSTVVAQLCRAVMLRAVCVVATAFEMGPTCQDAATFEDVVRLLSAIVAGDPHMCALVWDEGQDLLEAVRAVVRDAAAVFPAVPTPYLRMLSVFAHGPQAAAAAYQHLQTAPHLVALHHAGEGHIRKAGPTTVVLEEGVVWNQAPAVATMALPVGIQGQLLPLPAVLSHLDLDPSQWAMVCWDVGGTHGSFGQLLLLGRAVHCVYVLRSSPGEALTTHAALLEEVGVTVGLMATMATAYPQAVPDLMSISVEAAGAGGHVGGDVAKETWLDVATAVVALMADLAAAPVNTRAATTMPAAGLTPVDIASSALQLMQAISSHHPELVCASLQSIPLLSAAPVSLGLPPALPLSALPSVQAQHEFAQHGLMPGLAVYRQQVEGPSGTYPVTKAFIRLVSSFLARGFCQEPISTYALYCLRNMLPWHSQWSYKNAEERWSMTADLLQVVRLAVEAGACVGAQEGAPTPLVGARGDQADSRLWEQCITPLAAATLTHLLFHGGPLLHHCLPPPLPVMEDLRQADAMSAELAACEGALAALLRLLPCVVSATEAYSHELPVEEFLFLGLTASQQAPASLLVSYLAYNQPELEQASGASISYLALKLLQALQATVARPVQRSALVLSLSALVPRGSGTEAALKELFRPSGACAYPAHFMVAVEIFEAAASRHPEVLEGLTLPTSLDPTTTRAPASQDAKPAATDVPALPAPAPAAGDAAAVVPAAPKPAGEKSRPAPPAWSVLNGLVDLMADWAQLKDGSPEVLCLAMRAVCALWQEQGAGHPLVHLLRQQQQLWAGLEGCITRGAPLGEWEPADDAWLQLAEAYAWQVVMLEAYACPRNAPGAGAGGPGTPSAATALVPAPADNAAGAAGRAGAAGSKVWEVVDRVVGKGVIAKALPCYASLGITHAGVHRLQALLHALYIELGAAGASAVAPAGQSGALSWGNMIGSQDRAREQAMACHAEVHQELLAITKLVKEGGGYDMDAMEQVHELLMEIAGQGEEAKDDEGDAGHSPGYSPSQVSLAGFSPMRAIMAPPSMKVTVTDMASKPLGRALLRHTAPIHTITRQAACYGPGYLLDASRLATLLGPLGQQLASAELLSEAMSSLSMTASLASARLAALQAASALVAVVSKEGQGHSLAPDTLVALAAAMTTACVSELVRWSSDESVRLVKAPWSGLSSLMADIQEAAVCVSRLLLHALSAAKMAAATAPKVDGAATTPALFRSATRQAAPAAPSAPGGGLVSDTACMQLTTTFASWLRTLQHSTLHGAAVRSITDYLASSLLCALQATLGGGARGGKAGAGMAGDGQQALSLVLADLLPLVCDACKAEHVNVSVGTQVVLALATHLPPADWLPVLQSKLNITAMLASAAATHGDVASKEATQGGDLGLLELALTVAKTAEGAQWLHECGVLEFLKGLMTSLLSADGGRLAAFASISLHHPHQAGVGAGGRKMQETLPLVRPPSSDGDTGAGGGAPGPDTAHAYACGVQTAVHKQWVVLLSFAAALLRTLSQFVDVEAAAIELLGAAESRMLLMCLPPRGDASQPLTLASLTELERVLFLLTHLAKYTGTWHLLLPGSLPKFRMAVTSFIAFAASNGSSSKPVTLECPPQTPDEVRMAAQAAGLPKTEGWFRVCFLGASDPGGVVIRAAAPAPATPAARLGAPLLSAPPATPGAGQATPPQATPTTATEYSARMAESMYACVLHALVFLRASAPQVSEGESSSLGATWPKPRELAVLQEQALEALYSVADAPRAPGDARRTRITNNLLRILQLLCDFLNDVGCPSSASRAMNAKLSSQLQLLEDLLKKGERLPQKVALTTPMSPSHSLANSGLDMSLSGGLSGSLPDRGLSGTVPASQLYAF